MGGRDVETHPTIAGVELRSSAICGMEGTNVPVTKTVRYTRYRSKYAS